MAHRSNYWSCSRFADWIRGTKKLKAGTSSQWRDWKTDAKNQQPFRYWVAEELLDDIQNFLMWPIDKLYDAKYYFNNRWISKSHACTAHKNDIKPGQWHDVGYRFLPCLFNELVDFVEIELAWLNIVWDDEAAKKYQSPWYARGWKRFRVWRCPEAGLDNLEWQAGLEHEGKPTPQAEAAMEIRELYYWWKHERPKRPDVYDETGWTEYCETDRKKHPDCILPVDESDEDKAKVRKMLNEINELEEKYEQEDEDMLIRLIKVRRALWT